MTDVQQPTFNKLINCKTIIRVLQLATLNVDPVYQREVKSKHKQIVADFNPLALGTPLVGQRSDGTMWVVDGYQRVTALRKLDKKFVRCEVFASSGQQAEAIIFVIVNKGRARLTSAEDFRGMLAGHDPLAWAIKEAVEAEGFVLKLSSKSGRGASREVLSRQLSCINTVLKVANSTGGIDALRFALSIIKESWPADPNGPHIMIVGSMGLFYNRHGGMVDRDRLIPRLQTATPQQVMFTASQMVRTVSSGDRFSNGADVIEKLYQKRKGKHKA